MRGVWLILISVFGLTGTAAGDVTDDAAGDAMDAAEIFRGLHTPRDVPVAFIEHRGNALLSEPLVLTGSVVLSTDGELSKIITGPVHESVVITPDRIRLERDGHAREMPIGRQKGAREFYLGLRALLGGDLDTVTELFEITVTRGGDDGWRIELVPRKQRMKKFVERMIVSGEGSTIMRIHTIQSVDSWQEMIFDSVGHE
jgi:hypothetical protein